MNEVSYELIPQEKIHPKDVFFDGKTKPILDLIRETAFSFERDMETEAGRKKIASVAHQIARTKTFLDNMGKALVVEQKAIVDKANRNRKQIRTDLDSLKTEYRKDLTEWEEAQKLKLEKIERELQELTQKRMAKLQKLDVCVSYAELLSMDDDHYNVLLNQAKTEYEKIQAKLAAEAAARKAEDERLEKVRKEQEAEAAKQKAAGNKIDAANRKFEADMAKFEADKKAEQERIDREEFERKAKIEAEAKTKEEAKERAEREERERIAQEEAEAAEAARQEALKPDKEKVLCWLNAIRLPTSPSLNSDECIFIVTDTADAIETTIHAAIDEVENL